MNSFLGPVSAFAVWGSLAASFILAISMFVQCAYDSKRRWQFGFLGLVACTIAIVDLFYSSLGPTKYELLRICVWPWYGIAVAVLCDRPRKLWFALGFVIQAIGFAAWTFVDPNIATTIVLPISFFIAARIHFRQYRETVGYASWLLTMTSIANGLQCSFYYGIVMTADPGLITLGYLHYAIIALVATIEGWVQLPRELRGKMPVQVPHRQAITVGIIFLTTELLILGSLLTTFDQALPVYLGAFLVQMGAYLFVFFRHRHNLVIFTDDVSQLLEQRTQSLIEARQELLAKNMEQASLLESQAVRMNEKNQTIERQRRLELAAQTAGQASHDIQNLISPMVVSLEQLEQGQSNSSGLSHPIRRLRNAVDQLTELNDQFLAMSRRGRIEQQPIRIAELMNELSERFPDSHLKMNEPDEELWLSGAWAQLLRALSNLVQNALEVSADSAVHFHSYRHDVRQTRPCHLGFLSPGQYVVFEVTDRGPGIAADTIEHIWEPFFSSKKSGPSSGSGLGLSVVAAIVDDHKGVVDLKTSSDGTTFYLYFPLLKEEPSQIDITGEERLLIVDDDPKVHSELTSGLAPLGYKIYSCFDGLEALRMLQIEEIDAAIVDMDMPKTSGLEALVGFLHIRPQLASIVYTSYVTKNVESKAYAYGAYAVLTKPNSTEDIARTIREALKAKRQEATGFFKETA